MKYFLTLYILAIVTLIGVAGFRVTCHASHRSRSFQTWIVR